MGSIFLSASVPVPGREYYDRCSPFQIHSAVRTFLTLALGRRHLVFGGHPSITPMVHAACINFGLEQSHAVTIYQSAYFEDQFPLENKGFADMRVVPAAGSLKDSVAAMRAAMLSEWSFDAGVFIGGMNGVHDEHAYFCQLHPGAVIVPVRHPGGAAADLPASNVSESAESESDASRDYLSIFIERLNIDPATERCQI